jgi:hypothetical protein
VTSFPETLAGISRDVDGDLAFANVETVVTDRNDLSPESEGKDAPFHFRSHPAAVKALMDVGFNMFALANNHAFDYGATGIDETLYPLHPLRARRPRRARRPAACRLARVCRRGEGHRPDRRPPPTRGTRGGARRQVADFLRARQFPASRHRPQADGSGLYCAEGAAALGGKLATLCQGWQPAAEPDKPLADKIADACEDKPFYGRPAAPKRRTSSRRESSPSPFPFQGLRPF